MNTEVQLLAGIHEEQSLMGIHKLKTESSGY